MANTWTYGENIMSGPTDLSGFSVEAADGEIGKIDEATYDAGNSYVIVDTGFWIFGKRRMIPAHAVSRVDTDSRTVWVDLTKSQIKDAPDYDREKVGGTDYRKLVSSYYDKPLHSGYSEPGLT